MPNDQSVDYDWTKYRVPAKRIEQLTGYKLFPTIPADVAAAIKESADDVKVRVPGSRSKRGRE